MQWPFTLQDTATALLILVGGLLSIMGIRHGKQNRGESATPHDTDFMLAGAVIDNKRADEIVAALDRNTQATHQQTEEIKGFRQFIIELKQDTKYTTRETITELKDLLRDFRRNSDR